MRSSAQLNGMFTNIRYVQTHIGDVFLCRVIDILGE
jgi:hypothetical protein